MTKVKHKTLFFSLIVLSMLTTTGAIADVCLHGGNNGRVLIQKQHAISREEI
jgi:hypothetical protein